MDMATGIALAELIIGVGAVSMTVFIIRTKARQDRELERARKERGRFINLGVVPGEMEACRSCPYAKVHDDEQPAPTEEKKSHQPMVKRKRLFDLAPKFLKDSIRVYFAPAIGAWRQMRFELRRADRNIRQRNKNRST
ncbi:MAG: hypothetical protein KGI82_02720 [Betaproteobacteria bacterium]|nr:hypothetical protein [Betaproteobacteria bacterium]